MDFLSHMPCPKNANAVQALIIMKNCIMVAAKRILWHDVDVLRFVLFCCCCVTLGARFIDTDTKSDVGTDFLKMSS